MHDSDFRRCTACGELSITAWQRFVGGWFFIRCSNCRRRLRVDPQHGQRWILLAAFALIGAASIALVVLTGKAAAFVVAGAVVCMLLYVWEFLLTRRSPLEVVTAEEARGYLRNWTITALAALFATVAIAFAVMQA
jgi:hypothetical protein